jgi:uncharacterized protein (DUF2147 family)
MSPKIIVPFCLMILLPATSSSAQTVPSLAGVWRQSDGSATVRISPCEGSSNWCATMIDQRLNPGEPSLLNQMVVRDMRSNGKLAWTGRYVVDGQSMKASAKLRGPDALSFKVCAMAFLCDTIIFNRQIK